LPFARIVDDFEGSYDLVANEGPVFFLRTNRAAPRYKVVKVDISPALEAAARELEGARGGAGDNSSSIAPSAPFPSYASSTAALAPADGWEEVIPEHEQDVLQGVVALKGDLVVTRWLRDCVSGLELRTLTTGKLLRPLPLPSLGDVSSVSGTRKSAELFFSFTSFVEPGATYRIKDAGDVSQPPPLLFRATKLSVSHDPNDFITERLHAVSKDGTKVPLFVTRHKSVPLDGNNPTLLYGYGGFSISLTASFSASRLAWMRGFKGVFAQANLRGGGEFGVGWRDAGSVLNKQNVFDDFAACAETLIEKGYSKPGKVVIQGGSNGGLLVAACANQRPDLFGAVIGQVGVMDMLRFHRFTIGHAW
jgi:prolyl oligopeptidase